MLPIVKRTIEVILEEIDLHNVTPKANEVIHLNVHKKRFERPEDLGKIIRKINEHTKCAAISLLPISKYERLDEAMAALFPNLPAQEKALHLEIYNFCALRKLGDAAGGSHLLQGKTLKVVFQKNQLIFGDKKVAMSRGYKEMMGLFFPHMKEQMGERVVKSGKSINMIDLKKAGGYATDGAFRDALKKLRKKLKDSTLPVTITNPKTYHYQLEVVYPS